tara:strand:- start:1203 stop:1646 length:444 start_codon:yes stop_codon:yes gene_type:complete
MKIEIILLIVIVGVLVIDFIFNSRKKSSIDEAINRIEEKKTIKSKGLINYIIDRKRNIVSFIIGIHILKVLLHYYLYPAIKKDRFGFADGYNDFAWHINNIYTLTFYDYQEWGSTYEYYYGQLWLFIPSLLILAVIIWLFNDKIKAR